MGTFSPDGEWMLYASNEPGRYEVFVAPFPGPGRKWQVSTAGGLCPEWRGDGGEIFYQTPDANVMAVGVERRGETLAFGKPRALFALETRQRGFRYSPSPDGQLCMPFCMALPPAKRSMPMTIHRMTAGLVLARMRTPTRDPSMMPMTEGTTIMGRTAPLLM